MTVELIELIATKGVFRPRQHFSQLAADHVPFDELLGQQRFEASVLQAVTNDEPAGIVGPRGAGKSSLIAYVCDNLPSGYVALRVPVTGADEPDNVSVVAAVALSQALADLELEREQRETLERARGDQQSEKRTPGGLRGGTLGGGPIPAAVHAELATLQEQLTTNRLAAERLAGLDRLISILVARCVQPLFVLEDTEAAIGGADRPDLAAAFLAGPVRAFANELETPCLVAIQSVFTESPEFPQLTAGMRIIEIPGLGDNIARHPRLGRAAARRARSRAIASGWHTALVPGQQGRRPATSTGARRRSLSWQPWPSRTESARFHWAPRSPCRSWTQTPIPPMPGCAHASRSRGCRASRAGWSPAMT
jgi:hypothetical protein